MAKDKASQLPAHTHTFFAVPNVALGVFFREDTFTLPNAVMWPSTWYLPTPGASFVPSVRTVSRVPDGAVVGRACADTVDAPPAASVCRRLRMLPRADTLLVCRAMGVRTRRLDGEPRRGASSSLSSSCASSSESCTSTIWSYCEAPVEAPNPVPPRLDRADLSGENRALPVPELGRLLSCPSRWDRENV